MIYDVNEELSARTLYADLCIIGSGPAGLTIAREFMGTSSQVIILEGGGEEFEDGSQSPYSSIVIGKPHLGIHRGRARVFGGTSTLWAGQALPLLNIDFEKRDWVPYSGWPFPASTLEPFYRRAEDTMQIPHSDYGLQSWPGPSRPPYEQSTISLRFSQFTSVPNFATKYGQALAKATNISIFLHANVTELRTNEAATEVSQVIGTSFNGKQFAVRAKFIVVCCGAIETARILLASNSVEKCGIGNQHDVVGRFFQDHPYVSFAVKPQNKERFRKWCHSLRKKNIRFSLKMVASETMQRRERITNVGAEVYYPLSGTDPLSVAKGILRIARQNRSQSDLRKAVKLAVKHPWMLGTAAYRYYIKGQPASVGYGQPRLGVFCEQSPTPESRVTLSSETDSIGVRKAVLDWRVTGSEKVAAITLLRALTSEWRRLNIGEIEWGEFEEEQRDAFIDQNHHIGTTRLGVNPKTSVLDESCRVHGYRNLFVGSSAAFPTGGFSNPTLTVLALCIRISDRIKHDLGT